MPTRPPRLCPRHRTLVHGDCPQCAPPWKATKRNGSTRRSRKLRRLVLTEQPICAGYGPTAGTCRNLATEDDHRIPIGEGGTDDRDNHQGLCPTCHKAKSTDETKRGGQRSRR